MIYSPIQSPIRSPIQSAIIASDEQRRGASGPQLISPPAAFGWTPPVSVYYEAGAGYSTDYDETPFLIEGAAGVTTYYVDASTGNDANPGTSGSPKRSLVPITGGRVTKLLIKARGTFYRDDGGNIQMGHDNLCVEAWGGAACIITKQAPTGFPLVWTDEGGGTWSAPAPYGGFTGMNVYLGTDVDALTRYTYAADLATCQATPSTHFRTTGPTKFWVHTSDGTSPATGHTIYNTNGSAGTFAIAAQAFVQRMQFVGISFRGGDAAYGVSGDSAFTKSLEFVNCNFKRASTFAALNGSGTCTVISYGCTAGPSVFDGFSSSTASGGAGGSTPNMVEINCIGANNGAASGANQGSTVHFGAKIVRVNCTYSTNANDQIADVGAGTRSWNLGCTFGPRGIQTTANGVQAGNDATDVRIWLDGCAFDDVAYDVSAASGASLYYKNMAAPSVNPASTGVIAAY